MHDAATARDNATDEHRVQQLEGELAELRGAFARLRQAYNRALEELALARRRLFVAKAERIDTSADQLAFDKMFEQVEGLEKALSALDAANADTAGGDGNEPIKKRRNSTGRRDLAKTPLPVERVELEDPELEGKAERIGFEESQRVVFKRGGRIRLVLARIVYKPRNGTTKCPSLASSSPRSAGAACATKEVCVSLPDSKLTETAPTGACCEPSTAICARPAKRKSTDGFRIVTAPMPKELFPRGLLAPSMIAHILFEKYVMGVPFYRQEQQSEAEGFCIDRATMCRYAEHAGATLGAIVEAARKEALATAFCLSTDATGIAIQPTPLEDGKRKRQPCRKGHFFVTLADRDHVFFDYQPKHNSAAVWEMFKGFSGYVQADAHAIYDALFRGTPPEGVDEDDQATRAAPPKEVACWSHARRKFWEAAVCKHPIGLDGLRLIDKIFEADRLFADVPPSQRKRDRDLIVRPIVDAFFLWAKNEQAKIKERGLVASALGYALRQHDALRRFLDDGRLRLDNNAAERALRTVAIGRKNWLFCGSDDHASAAANLFSLFASCKLHRLDSEAYLDDVIKVMPYWPRDRYLELAPKYWARTRARLAPHEIERSLGHITVPPPLTAEEKATSG